MNFLRLRRNLRLTFRSRLRIFPSPAVTGPDLSREQIPTTIESNALKASLEAARKKVLDGKQGLRETGNPPLDGAQIFRASKIRELTRANSFEATLKAVRKKLLTETGARERLGTRRWTAPVP